MAVMTVQELIDETIRRMIGTPLEKTVDTVKFGNPQQPLTGVVVSFMATRVVLQRAVERGANLVITHEPSFYNHLDEVEWLANDPVYRSKKAYLEEHNIVLWRLHDAMHRSRPDIILTGMLRALGWNSAGAEQPNLYNIPPTTVGALAQRLKESLGIKQVRVAGDLQMPCSRVGLLVGACGGRRQIEVLGQSGVEVMVCGESAEWETCEYVRDSAAAGERKALIILGHANSEEAGMQWLAEWLRPLAPEQIPVVHEPAGDPFQFV